MKILNIAAISTLLFAGPVLVADLSPTGIGQQGAAIAKGNNGNNRGRGGGSSRRNENAGRPVNPGNGHPATAGNGQTRRMQASAVQGERPRNVHAQLKGLNSLNRNINGLMNSADPKMDLFREFVMASADYEAALEMIGTQTEGFDPNGDYQALLEGLGLTMPTDVDGFKMMAEGLEALAAAPEPLLEDFADEAAYQVAFDAWTESTASAKFALSHYQTSDLYNAITAADTAQEASSEEVMIEAMVAGLNATGAGPVSVEDMSPEMIEWVSQQLGIGDMDGLIDDYVAQSVEPTESPEPGNIDG